MAFAFFPLDLKRKHEKDTDISNVQDAEEQLEPEPEGVHPMSLDKNQWSYARFQQTPDGIAAWLSEKAERVKCFTNTFGFCTY